MKCVHTFGTGRHTRQADITLLFENISLMIKNILFSIALSPFNDRMFYSALCCLSSMTES